MEWCPRDFTASALPTTQQEFRGLLPEPGPGLGAGAPGGTVTKSRPTEGAAQWERQAVSHCTEWTLQMKP